MVENGDDRRGDAWLSEQALLADDFDQLARALAELIENDRHLSAEATAIAARPAAIFAEAWELCGLDAATAELAEDWADAFTADEREELEGELPAIGAAPLIRFLYPEEASPVMVLVLPVQPYAHWPMVKAWLARTGKGGRRAHVALRLAALDPRQDRFNRARSMFRLTAGEERLLCRLAQAGTLREAAARDGVKYETARTTLKDLLAKSGHPRQPALVGAAIKLAALDEPLDLDSDAAMREAFGLSPRQSAIARLFALGRTREEVAGQLGLSVETIKAELKVVYTALGVGNATALSVIAAQIGLAARMLAARDVGAVDLAASSEPVRLIARTDRPGRISFADYGPPGLIPTFQLHTATTSRYLPRSYIAALQARGLRPVAIDRPGFGFSEMVEGDYFEQTARDVLAIADALHAPRFNLIARGATTIAHLIEHHRDRIARVVVTNPEPPQDLDKQMGGIQGAYKRIFYSLPGMIVPLANQLANRVSDDLIERMILKFLGDSPADRKVLSNPENMRAHVYANRLAALQGGKGLAAVGLSEPRKELGAVPDGSFITVLCGGEDPMYRPGDSTPRLERAWPGVKINVIADAGRLLHLQYPELIAAALTDGPRMSAVRRQSKR